MNNNFSDTLAKLLNNKDFKNYINSKMEVDSDFDFGNERRN